MSESADAALLRANQELEDRTIDLLRASDERFRLITDSVADIIWTAPITLSDGERAAVKTDVAAVADAVLDRLRFSFISSAATRVFGYMAEEIVGLPLRDICTPASLASIRKTMIERFVGRPGAEDDPHRQPMLEVEFRAKDGTPRWCEVVSTYLRDRDGMPTSILGITRDISSRLQAQQALRQSESTLRSLFEHLPDGVATIDRGGSIYFINRGLPDVDQEALRGVCGFDLCAPEYLDQCRRALDALFTTGQPQAVELQDVFGQWWLARLVLPDMEGESRRAMVIATNVTQEHLANEALKKEQQLLRRLLELQEHERRLTAYEIHDGFAQQLTGAMFRLQGFRDLHARDPSQAWQSFDSAVQLISRAIDETRRLIGGLRPPVLDEWGIVQAIEDMICEYGRSEGPEIEFVHDVAFHRLSPPLESAVFRIVQESLQNACRHSRGDRVRVELVQRGDRIHIDIRDWGVGFQVEAVEDRRFGLQGIRERVRLLEGQVAIESAPGKGTHVAGELPVLDGNDQQAETGDLPFADDAQQAEEDDVEA